MSRLIPVARLRWCSALATLLLLASPVAAQGDAFADKLGGFGGGFGGFGGGPAGDPVTFSTQYTEATADRPAVLMITAKIERGWHVYSLTQPPGGPLPTKITLAPSQHYRLLGQFAAFPTHETHFDAEVFQINVEEHKGEVTWYAPIEFTGAPAPIDGEISLQACRESCVPVDATFTAKAGSGVPIGPLTISATPVEQPAPTEPVAPAVAPASGAAEPGQAGLEAGGYDLSRIELGEPLSLPVVLGIALVGGFVLNFMPCVLPVIGLKVMSFVEQAGHSRGKAFTLNLWYSLGILLVFWVLAGLVVFFGATFGDHFGDARFNIIVSAIVFALALSMMGVWEIPIPGFAGRGKAQELAQQEGAFGALVKGVLTTVLATPCTGPGVGAALGWCAQQSGLTTFGVFTTIGLGMAAPYLLIGAFPALVKFLPRPGAWMDRFKQFLGFVLMATVVWLLSSLHTEMLLPTLAFFVAVGLACWVYALIPVGADWNDAFQSYALCAAILLGGAVLSYAYLLPDVYGPRFEATVARAANDAAAGQHAELIAKLQAADPAELESLLAQSAPVGDGLTDQPWQSFTLKKLQRAVVDSGQTVLVDFSAEWCATCKVLENTVLHTQPVEEAVEQAGVLTMYGDFTHKPVFLKETLKALGAGGVPVIAIFPAGDPYRPIVFRDGYTQGSLIEAIEQATGSGANPSVASLPGLER